MAEVRLNFRALDTAASEALSDTVEEFSDAAAALFEDERFAWPHETNRRSGEVAGTLRDVYDTGALANSQETEKVSAHEFRVNWTADYAAAVFVGAVFENRNYTMPARNVPAIALREFEFEDVFARKMRRRL